MDLKTISTIYKVAKNTKKIADSIDSLMTYNIMKKNYILIESRFGLSDWIFLVFFDSFLYAAYSKGDPIIVEYKNFQEFVTTNKIMTIAFSKYIELAKKDAVEKEGHSIIMSNIREPISSQRLRTIHSFLLQSTLLRSDFSDKYIALSPKLCSIDLKFHWRAAERVKFDKKLSGNFNFSLKKFKNVEDWSFHPQIVRNLWEVLHKNYNGVIGKGLSISSLSRPEQQSLAFWVPNKKIFVLVNSYLKGLTMSAKNTYSEILFSKETPIHELVGYALAKATKKP
ncbi:MAG: hypothetical protein ACTSW1_12050 [Candidatus Hodarchaeales archaeon]